MCERVVDVSLNGFSGGFTSKTNLENLIDASFDFVPEIDRRINKFKQ